MCIAHCYTPPSITTAPLFRPCWMCLSRPGVPPAPPGCDLQNINTLCCILLSLVVACVRRLLHPASGLNDPILGPSWGQKWPK